MMCKSVVPTWYGSQMLRWAFDSAQPSSDAYACSRLHHLSLYSEQQHKLMLLPRDMPQETMTLPGSISAPSSSSFSTYQPLYNSLFRGSPHEAEARSTPHSLGKPS